MESSSHQHVPEVALRGDGTDDPGLIADMRWLGRLAARIVQDPGLAEDACQEAWLAAASKQGAAPDRSELAHGVRRFVHRHWRGARRRQLRERHAAANEALPSTEELLVQREQQERVWSTLVQLDEPFRSTLLLRFQEGLSTRSIAERSGIAEDTVRWRIREGTRRLRQRLAADEAGGGLGALIFALPFSMRDVAAGSVEFTAGAGSLAVFTKLIGVALMLKLILATAALAVALFFLVPPDTEGPKSVVAALQPEAELSNADSNATAVVNPPPVDAARAPASKPSQPTPEEILAELREQDTEPWVAPILRMRIRTSDGSALPAKASVKVIGHSAESFIPGVQVNADLSIEAEIVEVPLGSNGAMMGAEYRDGLVEVTAEGFGTQKSAPFEVRWGGGDVSEVDLVLWRARSVNVLALHEGTEDVVQEVRYAMVGPSARFGTNITRLGGGVVTLNLSAPGSDDDLVHVEGVGVSLATWTTSELLALPVDFDGTRHLELRSGCKLFGKIQRSSGLALPEGTELRYSMRGQETRDEPGIPFWMLPSGEVEIGADGSFELDALPPGLLVAHLRKKSRSIVAPQLSPDFVVAIPRASQTEVVMVVPDDPQIVTCTFSWGDHDNRALFADLYRAADDLDGPYADRPGERELLFQKNWFTTGEAFEVILPAGTLTKDTKYILSIGLGPNRRLERYITFEGDAPQITHAFAHSARAELPPVESFESDADADDDRRRQDARREGAKVVLTAR